MHSTTDTEKRIYNLQRELVGRRYAGASLASIASGKGGNDVIKWLKAGKNFLIYLGCSGIGKTYFCSALIPWAYKKFPDFRYWKERDLLAKIRMSMQFDKGDFSVAVSNVCDNHFTMLDDLGSSGVTDWRRDVMLEFIDNRYESELPTLITSNLSRDQILEMYGSRVHSRIFSKENLIIEMHEEEDLRQREPITK